jgi:molecular chaperone DnaK
VEIHVLQGERSMATDNRTLGKFKLEGIAPAPRGMPQIEVSFDIDANGIVNVSAKDQATGQEQHITISGGSGLDQAEIDKAVHDAERYADDDRQRKEAVDVRNESDHVSYEIQRILDENRGKLGDETVRVVEQKLQEVKRLKEGDLGQLKAALQELKTVSQRMGEEIYRQQAGQAPGPVPGSGPQGPGQNPAGDDVIDAEFTEG